MKRALLFLLLLQLNLAVSGWGVASQSEPGRICGRVTDVAGKGVQAIEVWAFDESKMEVAGCETAADGSYCIAGLPPGKYRVQFSAVRRPPLNGAWYKDKLFFLDASPLELVSGQELSAIDAVLVSNGSISGRVTDRRGHPLSGIDIWLSGNCLLPMDFPQDPKSDRSGRFHFSDLPPCYYQIRFNDRWEMGYTGEERAVQVHSGEDVKLKDASLFRAASLEIFVSDLHGEGIDNISVRVHHANGEEGGFPGYNEKGQAAKGYYHFARLPAGKCRIQFDAKSKYDPEFLSCWYNQRTDAGKADYFVLKPGPNRLNVRLKKYGVVSGTVRDGFEAKCIPVFLRKKGGAVYKAVIYTDGHYHTERLPSGSYQVFFMARSGSEIDLKAFPSENRPGWYYLDRQQRRLLSQWYPVQADRAGAQWIKVDWEREITGIDARLQPETQK